jgi:hypothetical protein
MKILILTPLLLAAAVAVPACAGSNVETATPPMQKPGTAVLHIRNDNTMDMNVYVVSQGMTWLLDLVPGLSSDHVKFPVTVGPGTEFRVLVDPIGDTGAYLSDPLFFSNGDDYQLTVGGNLVFTTLMPVTAGP